MSDEVMDVELTMHAFRLMRSGNYRRADAVIAAMQEDFPEIPKERLMQIMAALCRKLREND